MTLAVVLIGRNEGARLVASLASLDGRRVVYVDSGSTDHSVAAARAAGAQVVDLDPAAPFTAARARHAGFEALGPMPPEVVQFIDGDCTVVPGWIEAGFAALQDDPDLGLVTGWRSEMAPDASVYNALCDHEWHRPAGRITACGGDMMVRSAAYIEAGGFDAQVIAAEDDEFCQRLRKAGWGLRRLPLPMTRHDAAMTRFGQWWRRAVRSGHGFAQVGDLQPGYFTRERTRVWIYGLGLPVLALAGLVWGPLLVLVLAAYLLSYTKTVQGLRGAGLATGTALHHAVFLALSKFPNLIGMLTYYARKRRGAAMRIIEYK
ncbi:glycosyl transferase family 2 [Roseovarius sp. A-2]|uniref:glycosyltransferase n=1 Tax=Roseovarius sp. A-2 TaxID=1570360 RepID=UPI0009B54A4B|nr:glycosyltransferase family 2 protein [Roseovarius sp. A-2]GAW36139.1 glycosyl transferase family 2 [Roseovarius sp. A-2]